MRYFLKEAFRFWVFMEFFQNYLIFLWILWILWDSVPFLLTASCISHVFGFLSIFFRSFRTLCLFAKSLLHIKIASRCDVLWKMQLGFWFFEISLELSDFSVNFLGISASLLTASCILHVFGFFWSFFWSFRTLCLFADGLSHIKIASGCDVLWEMHFISGLAWNSTQAFS